MFYQGFLDNILNVLDSDGCIRVVRVNIDDDVIDDLLELV